MRYLDYSYGANAATDPINTVGLEPGEYQLYYCSGADIPTAYKFSAIYAVIDITILPKENSDANVKFSIDGQEGLAYSVVKNTKTITVTDADVAAGYVNIEYEITGLEANKRVAVIINNTDFKIQ